MPISALGAIHAKAQFEHVALLDVGQTVLVRAVWFFADAIFEQRSAHRHALWVEFMQEPTCVSFHTEAFQPIGTHRLSVVLLVVAYGLPNRCARRQVGCNL